MFYLTLKSEEKLKQMITFDSLIVVCRGCDEIKNEDFDLFTELTALGVTPPHLKFVETFHVCADSDLEFIKGANGAQLDDIKQILAYSCGVGVQHLATSLANKNVLPLCDTHILQGFQGVTPSEFGCDLCGECHLNETASICPITSCAKSLVNGPCGGCSDGKCEINPQVNCGWERIYSKLAM